MDEEGAAAAAMGVRQIAAAAAVVVAVAATVRVGSLMAMKVKSGRAWACYNKEEERNAAS